MKKKIGFACIILLIIALAGCTVMMVKKNRADQQAAQERLAALQQAQTEELVPLRAKETELQQKIAALQETITGGTKQVGSAVVLFREPSVKITGEIQQIMDTYKVQGTILLSPDALPGTGDYLSVREMVTLTDAGWDLCVPYLPEDEMEQLLATIRACALPTPVALYIDEETTVDTGLSAYMNRFGLQAVITWDNTEIPGGVVSIAAHSHREEKESINTLFDSLRSTRTYVAVTVGFGNSDSDAYSATRLNNILNYCAYYAITVTTVTNIAQEAQTLPDADLDTETLTQQLQEATQELEDVQAQIKAVTTKIGE